MCRRFKTTPDCIPFFEKELRALETRIYESTMEEERKFLTAMKALNLKYLVALYEKRKEMTEHDMPFHLSQLHSCITSVEYNVKNCYMREAEKELYKAQFICKTLLQPELNELKDLMNRKGSEYVIEKHPEMKPIIDDIENIESEVTVWVTMKIGKVQKSMKKRK